MTNRTSALSFVVFTSDQHLQNQLEQTLKHTNPSSFVTTVKDIASLQKTLGKSPPNVVILETRKGKAKELLQVQECLDPSRTFLMSGSRDVLRHMSDVTPFLEENASSPPVKQGSLENYLDSKLGEFVKGMKNGSARNLHPMLIKAVERPLISHALRETNGNQIKTANLLGMNRNTLRKKITELRIPIKRLKNVKSP